MTHPSMIAQLLEAQDGPRKIAALRSIKNDIVGHPLKKAAAVTQGIIEPLVRLLARQSTGQDAAGHDYLFATRPMDEEETIRLQALQILASIAQGGPLFLAPINNAFALQVILPNICPKNNPTQIVVAALRIVSNMVACAGTDPSIHTVYISAISDAFLARQQLKLLTRILLQTSHAANVQSSIGITASLIVELCIEERHRHALASSGVLDALATRIAGFVVAEGLVIPGAEILARRDELQDHFPPPAPRSANLAVLLQAVAAIITESKLRACQLLYSPSILAVLPGNHGSDYIAGHVNEFVWSSAHGAVSNTQTSQLNALEYLLPRLTSYGNKTSSAHSVAFPALGSSSFREHRNTNGRTMYNKNPSNSQPSAWNSSSRTDIPIFTDSSSAEEQESPFVAYLLYILRSRDGMGRLAAAAMLAVLYRAGLLSTARESAIATLVIPLLLELTSYGDAHVTGRDPARDTKILQQSRLVQERTPAVLAMFVTDNEFLQKAACDAHAIPRLCTMLKLAYDPVSESSINQPWVPSSGQSSLLAHMGFSPLILHNIKVRESTLRAIAALIPFKDEYRKVVVDEGLVPYILESLNIRPGKPAPKSNEKVEAVPNDSNNDEANLGYGINPLPVIIAACGAVRALARSVSILRTTLIDVGITPPIISLLHHPDIEVQIAATATMCNLVTDISPMRDMIIEAGVVKILCEHAHSTNARLRLNALWALKHFVNAVSSDLKRQCVEELGQGWLVQLICDNTEDDAASLDRNDKGIAIDQTDEDVDMGQFEEQVDAAFSGSFTNSAHPASSSINLSRPIRDAERRLASLRDAETSQGRRAKIDDIAVQEQGLSLIRNLIGPTGPGASTEVPEMVDYILSTLGQDRVFHILASKVRSKTINAYSRRTSITATIQAPAPELILAVCMILVHMAASVPRHRQIVISQTSLLESLVKHMHHPYMEIRLAMCHLITNLTWLDDQGDHKACAARTAELVKLGFLEQLEVLEHDSELNVRERAKSAVWQMKQSSVR